MGSLLRSNSVSSNGFSSTVTGFIGFSRACITFSCICFQFMSKMAQKLSRVQMFEARAYAVPVFSKSRTRSALRMRSGISCSEVSSFIRSSLPFCSSIWRACLKLTNIFPRDMLVGC